MAYEQRENSGSTFKNKNPLGENSATLTGSALIDGVAYWMSSWVKTDKNGNKWMSHTFKRKDAAAPAKVEMTNNLIDDDIPF